MNHHPDLPPSSFPALAKCAHYKSKKRETKENKRGTRIHHFVAGLLSENTVGSLLTEDIEAVARADWSVKKLKELIGEKSKILGIEDIIRVTDGFDEITHGWVDVWGMCDEENTVFLADVKSGEYRDYFEQFACYALGLMDKTGMRKCRIIALFCDLEQVQDAIITLEEAEKIVFNIVAAVLHKDQDPPQENEYCAWCALKPTCPVWVGPSAKALALAPAKEVNGLAPYIANLEALKSDPAKVALAIEQKRKFDKVWEEVDLTGFAKAGIEAGQEFPGLTISHVRGREFYSPEDVEKILIHDYISNMGTQRAKRFISIDPKEFAKVWQEWSKQPLPIQPERANGFTKLVKAK